MRCVWLESFFGSEFLVFLLWVGGVTRYFAKETFGTYTTVDCPSSEGLFSLCSPREPNLPRCLGDFVLDCLELRVKTSV